jgi:hypothetical protein
MREQLIEQFWDDYYEQSGERQTDVALKKLLRSYRQSLDIGSKTANAIDKHFSLDDLIVCAKEEEHVEFAKTVAFAKKHLN